MLSITISNYVPENAIASILERESLTWIASSRRAGISRDSLF